MLTSSVLIVGVLPHEVEPMLTAGVGPMHAVGSRCPRCDGEIAGAWRGYERSLRLGERVVRLRIARARCRGPGPTHRGP